MKRPSARVTSAYGPAPRLRVRLVPTLTVVAGILLTNWPGIVSSPLLPPLGLVMLLSWRLMRSDVWALWAGIPLGLLDDLVGGQPLGSGVAIWTAILLALDIMDRRFVWRNFWMDWGLGIIALAFALLLGGLLARAGGPADVVALLFPQWLWSSLLLPLSMQLVAALDGWRLKR